MSTETDLTNHDDTNHGAPSSHYQFGPFRIASQHVFYKTPHSVAFVNLRPIVPGHVLVMPRRTVPLLQNLTPEEYTDLWLTVRIVQQDILQPHYFGPDTTSAFNIAVQDGPPAGQTVPHVHVHILPRQTGDYQRNDDIYQDIEEWAPRDAKDSTEPTTSLEVPDDKERKDRTVEQMAEEAALYRSFL